MLLPVIAPEIGAQPDSRKRRANFNAAENQPLAATAGAASSLTRDDCAKLPR
jgi:hypothetical protein